MTTRVSPSETIRVEIDELIAGSERGSLLEHFEEVARAAVRLVFQTALEAEVTEFLGRDRYARGERERDGLAQRLQHRDIKTTAGEVTLQRPKTRGTDEAFASRLLGTGVTRTNALESLVIAGFVRGLSVRDVEASLTDALGPESTVSKSTVSRICEAISDEFDTWKTRDLSGVELDYFFADGILLQDAPGRAGRTGARRLGHHGVRKARVPGPRARFGGEPRRLGRVLPRPQGPGSARPAAGHLRRRPGPHRRRRDRLRPQPPATLSDPSSPQHSRQGARSRPGAR